MVIMKNIFLHTPGHIIEYRDYPAFRTPGLIKIDNESLMGFEILLNSRAIKYTITDDNIPTDTSSKVLSNNKTITIDSPKITQSIENNYEYGEIIIPSHAANRIKQKESNKKPYKLPPFLTIITRHHVGRPLFLQSCRESLLKQTDQNFEHIILVDDVGRGMLYANKIFNTMKSKTQIYGQYVLILDDDDIIIYPDFVKDLKKVISRVPVNPDIVYFKGIIYPYEKSLPDKGWGDKPIHRDIGSFCFVTKPYLYYKHIHNWGTQEFSGDFLYLKRVHADPGAVNIKWWDKVICQTLRVSKGAPDDTKD